MVPQPHDDELPRLPNLRNAGRKHVETGHVRPKLLSCQNGVHVCKTLGFTPFALDADWQTLAFFWHPLNKRFFDTPLNHVY